MATNLNNYQKRRDAGLISLAKTEVGTLLTIRRFDPDDGTELKPEALIINQAELVPQLQSMLAQAEILKQLIEDVMKLEVGDVAG